MTTADPGYGSAPMVALAWDSVPEATSYELFISTTDGSFSAPPLIFNFSTTSVDITSGLTSGTTYYFAVRARDAYGESLRSTVKSVRAPYQYPVESITISATPATLVVGKTGQLSASFTPANASNQTVSWSSADTTIASVEADTGVITAQAVGTVTMTGTTADGGKTATCQVTVVADSVTGVTLDQTTLSVGVTKTAQLTATVAPTGVSNQTVNWSSSDDAIATVDSTGKITGIKEGGPVTITAKTAEGDFTKTCTVTVTEGYDVSVTDNKATLTKYYGENKAVVIPDTIDVDGTAVPVVAIGDSAFSKTQTEINAGDTGITAVTLPATVTSIGQYAFYNCRNLTTVTFASGSQLTTIGSSCFMECRTLRDIVLPDQLASIGAYGFGSCSALQTLALPESLTTIGINAFYFTALTTITIPSQITSIPTSAFYGCKSLATINLPAGLQAIGDTAFAFVDGESPVSRTFTFTGTAPTLGTAAIPAASGAATTTIRYPAAATGFEGTPWTDYTLVPIS